MKFKKLDIVFKSKKIESKNILAVYEYGDYLIVKFQFYTSKLSYNFGQNQYSGFKEAWGIFNKETYEQYTTKDKRKDCKDVVDKLIKSGKKFEELNSSEFYQIVQSKI